MHSTDIVGYTYKADQFCPDCVLAKVGHSTITNETYGRDFHTIEDGLDIIAAEKSIDRYDEVTFDSGDFPKVIFADQATVDDVCGGCGNTLR